MAGATEVDNLLTVVKGDARDKSTEKREQTNGNNCLPILLLERLFVFHAVERWGTVVKAVDRAFCARNSGCSIAARAERRAPPPNAFYTLLAVAGFFALVSFFPSNNFLERRR